MKNLIFFGIEQLEDMLKKGNVWYVRHYEAYFDKVYVIYLVGEPHELLVNGNTTLVSLGTGNKFFNLILAPYRLYKFARKIKPTTYLTADIVFSCWTSFLVKLLLRAKIYLMPVCKPEEIYKNTKKSLSGLPIWIERKLICLSFLIANRILTGKNVGNFVDWLSSNSLIKKKLVITNNLVESLPSDGFFQGLQDAITQKSTVVGKFSLVYVGRLHREKLVDDLIKMMAFIKKLNTTSVPITLNLIGDGPEKPYLEKLATELGVYKMINFVGVVQNKDLPTYLVEADAFVSTLTGTSLREAALCGLPIIAYDMAYISGILKHEHTALLVEARDYKAMAQEVIHLKEDKKLRKTLSRNVKELAWKLWSPENLQYSLQQAFQD